jgi:putative addiction module component (TIGR02574 family)
VTRPAGQLLEEALELPEHDRAEIAARLIESLDPASDEDAPAAWGDEIRRRLEELDRGETPTVPWPEARRMILDDSDDTSEA